MTGVEFVLAVVKILIVIGFLMNMAAIATWMDRRQSAMVQHRVGPNRAVVYVPGRAVQAIMFLPGVALGALSALVFSRPNSVPMALERFTVATQLSILVVWFNVMVLAWYVQRHKPINSIERALSSVSPRNVFYTGLAVHAVGFVFVRMLPTASWFTLTRPAGVLLGALLVGAALYAASRVPVGTVGIRLAGTLHALADAMKLIWKEDFVPKKADRLLHSLAPIIAMFPALVTFAVIPFGDALCFEDANKDGVFQFGDLLTVSEAMGRDGVCAGHGVPLQIVDLNVGLLYIFAIGSTGIIGAAIAGWASDNKFALLGGLRAASQMVSYEVAMGLSIVGVLIVMGTLRLGPMVQWQSMHAWGIFVQPVAFFLFLTCLAAENKRVPFDQPEGESEIVAGYFLEYSGMKFGMFMTSEYVELITSSAILVTLFLGGYSMPFLHADGITVAFGDTMLFEYKMNHVAVTLLQMGAFFGKTVFVSFVQVFFRWTLPRFRYDQLMKLGWTKLLPVAIANLVVTALVWLALDGAGPGVQKVMNLLADITHGIVAVAMFAGVVAFFALILKPVKRKQFLHSTASKLAQAAGGTKPSPMQA